VISSPLPYPLVESLFSGNLSRFGLPRILYTKDTNEILPVRWKVIWIPLNLTFLSLNMKFCRLDRNTLRWYLPSRCRHASCSLLKPVSEFLPFRYILSLPPSLPYWPVPLCFFDSYLLPTSFAIGVRPELTQRVLRLNSGLIAQVRWSVLFNQKSRFLSRLKPIWAISLRINSQAKAAQATYG
jgi:hypothetical protein